MPAAGFVSAARMWVSTEKDMWLPGLLVHKTATEATIIFGEEDTKWVLKEGPSPKTMGLSPLLKPMQRRVSVGKDAVAQQKQVLQLNKIKMLPRNPAHLEGIDDLVKLQFLDEPNILYNLSLRYTQGKIYTNTGPILIAVNPWRILDIYSDGAMDMYKGRELGELPPHVYGVADSAYRAMQRDGKNQSILVSGESGAGKTESTKFVMSFLAYVSGSHSEAAARMHGSYRTDSKVLDSNPLLEAFGNAKTLRNDNSSRFGKYIDLHFGSNGVLLGGAIQTYLLEKARVVQQTPGERNFHIFHELVNGSKSKALPRDLQSKLRLEGRQAFNYICYKNEPLSSQPLSNPYMSPSPSVGDRRYSIPVSPETERDRDILNFQARLKALDSVCEDHQQKEELLSCVAGILHLGNCGIAVNPKDTYEAMSVERSPSFDAVCFLFGVRSEDFEKALCKRTVIASVEDVYDLPVSYKEAIYTRDALAKALYTRLFDWLVTTINTSLCHPALAKHVANKTSVLDIFGFEFFDVNRFEQFCINYANEKLQQQFVEFVFKIEQKEYVAEGIGWEEVEFKDNAACIALIESKPAGILSVLDEICIVPQGSDEAFCDKVRGELAGKPHFGAPNFPRNSFIVHHYAGTVVYNTEEFVDSNRDNLQPALIDLINTSTSPFMRALFAEKYKDITKQQAFRGGRKARSTLIFTSITAQFKTQLTTLVSAISQTSPHFVRCINPNNTKSPTNFLMHATLEQLRCGGVMDAVHVTRSGFGSRYPYAEFVKRYRPCAQHAHGKDDKQTCDQILKHMGLDGSLYRLGYTKMFLKHNVIELLETRRSETLTKYVVIIQCAWRGYKARVMLKKLVQEYIAKRKAAAALLTACSKTQLVRARHVRVRRKVTTLQRMVRGLLGRLHAPQARTSIKTPASMRKISITIEEPLSSGRTAGSGSDSEPVGALQSSSKASRSRATWLAEEVGSEYRKVMESKGEPVSERRVSNFEQIVSERYSEMELKEAKQATEQAKKELEELRGILEEEKHKRAEAEKGRSDAELKRTESMSILERAQEAVMEAEGRQKKAEQKSEEAEKKAREAERGVESKREEWDQELEKYRQDAERRVAEERRRADEEKRLASEEKTRANMEMARANDEQRMASDALQRAKDAHQRAQEANEREKEALRRESDANLLASHATERLSDALAQATTANKRAAEMEEQLRTFERELHGVEKELAQEREVRQAICLCVEDAARENDVAGLKKVLESVRERVMETQTSEAARALEACGQLVEDKMDMGAKIDALRAAKLAPKTSSSEVNSLQIRLGVLERELQQARSREAHLHKKLSSLRTDASAFNAPDNGRGEKSLRSLTAQNEAMIGELASEVEARRALMSLVLKIIDFCTKEGEEAGDQVTVCEELLRQSSLPAIEEVVRVAPDCDVILRSCTNMLLLRQGAIRSRSEAKGQREEDKVRARQAAERWWDIVRECCDAGASAHSVQQMKLGTAVLKHALEESSDQVSGPINSALFALARLLDSKSLSLAEADSHNVVAANTAGILAELHSENASLRMDKDTILGALQNLEREFGLERAARNQLSSFVYDISSVTDLDFLESRLAALKEKVVDERRLAREMSETEEGQDPVKAASAELLIRDMETCAFLLEDKVHLMKGCTNPHYYNSAFSSKMPLSALASQSPSTRSRSPAVPRDMRTPTRTASPSPRTTSRSSSKHNTPRRY